MKRTIAQTREAIGRRLPTSVQERLGPSAARLRMLFGDHLIVRTIFKNRHEIAPGVWRSAQPLPGDFRELRRQGIRTLINLRGKTKTATYSLEQNACEDAGIRMIDFPMKSRAAPSKELLRTLRATLEAAEKPFLFHCKSGSDRAGFVSALYLHAMMGMPLETAKKQLSLRYGHVRQADTGVLDFLFERYEDDCRKSPQTFFDWVEETYDPVELNRTFNANKWATGLVRTILRRE